MGGVVEAPVTGSSRWDATTSAGFGAGAGAVGADLVLGAMGAGLATTGAALGAATADGPLDGSTGLGATTGRSSTGAGLAAEAGLVSTGTGLISIGAGFGTWAGLISTGAAFAVTAGLAGGSFFEGAFGVGLFVFSAMPHSQGCNHYTYVAMHNTRFAAIPQGPLCSAA